MHAPIQVGYTRTSLQYIGLVSNLPRLDWKQTDALYEVYEVTWVEFSTYENTTAYIPI